VEYFFFSKLISPIIYNKLIYRVNLSEPFVGVYTFTTSNQHGTAMAEPTEWVRVGQSV